MDRLAAMATFAKVVEAGSLSAAARTLNISLAAVSRQLAALEERLGARLMNRTTRRLALTEGGRAYYERCRRILGDVDEAESALSQFHAEPAGRLAVSASVLFGQLFVGPLLPDFLARFPRVAVDLTLVDRFVNLLEEGFDVAIRIGALADSRLVARRLGDFRRVVCASPAYLRAHGAPREPKDLAQHACLTFSMLADADAWRFSVGGREVAVPISGPLRSNNQRALIDAAMAGVGLFLAPSWLVREPVAAGRLAIVLAGFEPAPTPIQAVYPHARLLSAKVRAFVDYLAVRWENEDFGGGITRPPARRGSRSGRRRSRNSQP